MSQPEDEVQERLLEEHLAGDHFGQPHPLCWSCWDVEDRDGENPECPDPFWAEPSDDDPSEGC